MLWNFHSDKQCKHLSQKSLEMFETNKKAIKSKPIFNFISKHIFFQFTIVQFRKHFPPELLSFTDIRTITSCLHDFRQI